MSIKTKKVVCKLNEGLREKNYNFSLKVKTKEGEYLSEHSEDFINPYAIIAAPTDTENYQYMMEECKNVKLKTFVANPMDISETKLSEKQQELDNETNTMDKTPSNSFTVSKNKSIVSVANAPNVKKEVSWEYNEENKNFCPVIEVECLLCFIL